MIELRRRGLLPIDLRGDETLPGRPMPIDEEPVALVLCVSCVLMEAPTDAREAARCEACETGRLRDGPVQAEGGS